MPENLHSVKSVNGTEPKMKLVHPKVETIETEKHGSKLMRRINGLKNTKTKRKTTTQFPSHVTCHWKMCRYVHWRPNGYHQENISVFGRGRLMFLLPPPAAMRVIYSRINGHVLTPPPRKEKNDIPFLNALRNRV